MEEAMLTGGEHLWKKNSSKCLAFQRLTDRGGMLSGDLSWPLCQSLKQLLRNHKIVQYAVFSSPVLFSVLTPTVLLFTSFCWEP